jgi:hypothetical protein
MIPPIQTWEQVKHQLLPNIRMLGLDRGVGADIVAEGFQLYCHQTKKSIIVNDDDVRNHCEEKAYPKVRTVILNAIEAITGRKAI